jgi:hypothetical protein
MAVFAETYWIWPTIHSHAAGRHRRCACARADRERLAIGRDAGVPKGRFCGAVSAKPLKTLVQENQRSGDIFGLTEHEPTSPTVARPLADEGKLGQPIRFRLASSSVSYVGLAAHETE